VNHFTDAAHSTYHVLIKGTSLTVLLLCSHIYCGASETSKNALSNFRFMATESALLHWKHELFWVIHTIHILAWQEIIFLVALNRVSESNNIYNLHSCCTGCFPCGLQHDYFLTQCLNCAQSFIIGLGIRGFLTGDYYATSRKVAGSSPNEVDFFSVDLILPTALWSWVRLSLQQKWVPGIFLGDKWRLERKADNLTAICEPII
jgi:hypothetical protein